MSAMNDGTRNGDTRPGPLWKKTSNCSSSVPRPPMPLPIMQPMSSPSAAMSSPDCSIASAEAAIARCVKRSIRRTSLRSSHCSASNPATSPAIFELEVTDLAERDRADAVVAGEQRAPRGVAPDPHRRHHPDPRDGDPSRLVHGGHHWPSQRPKTIAELCPPRPTEVLIACRTVRAARLVGYAVEVAVGVRLGVVDGGRDDAVVHVRPRSRPRPRRRRPSCARASTSSSGPSGCTRARRTRGGWRASRRVVSGVRCRAR